MEARKEGVSSTSVLLCDQDKLKGRGKKGNAGGADGLTGGVDRAKLAFLQYTSGSTSDPKGVKISHGNLAHNLSLIVRELQYHDMGLIGSLLGVLYCGGSGYYMSPISFVRAPPVWVKAISRYRGTHMQAPNFAFGLCARKWRDLRPANAPQLDLSCINGAEPVDEHSMRAFYDTFAPHGLPPGVIFPTYGLAEHTVFVCSGGRSRLRVDKDALEVDKQVEISEGSEGGADRVLVGCGYPFRGEGVDLKSVDAETRLPGFTRGIVDAETRLEVADGVVGEIWVTSASKACGYWRQHGKSVNAFCAQIGATEDADEGLLEPPDGTEPDWSKGYLRTGDEGFLYKEELFVCGRIKDLIIIGGRNHYPQDIEACACQCRADALRPGCAAAFSVDRQGQEELVLSITVTAEHYCRCQEELVLSCEVKDTLAKASQDELAGVATAVAAAVRAEHGVVVSTLLLVASRANSKTTSGKIARQWCKRAYLAGSLAPLYERGTSSEDQGDAGEGAPPADAGGGGIEMAHMRDVDIGGGAPVDVSMLSDDELQQRIAAILTQLAQGAPVPPDRPLHELGLDSLSMGQLSGVLEQDFNAKVPVEVLYSEEMTLPALAQLVRDGGFKGQGGGGGARDGKGSCETWLTNSCPCCLCLLGCPCFR
ncbi:hypothetical protein JKP88DRAFT_347140 [Tribonema minus]|uniref:Carrier domain-containing protein n=1 Tax=Tribonema minus TaxID=303371 RepID=A0A836C841_9STRA|nr:hypothetical protein JKP88DRAFT_347140 [Tribonema minus]